MSVDNDDGSYSSLERRMHILVSGLRTISSRRNSNNIEQESTSSTDGNSSAGSRSGDGAEKQGNDDHVFSRQNVNLSVLDALVVDYLRHEGLLLGHSGTAADMPSNGKLENSDDSQEEKDSGTLALLHRLKGMVLEGRVGEALNVVQTNAVITPVMVGEVGSLDRKGKAHQLLFRMHLQNVIEMMKRGAGNLDAQMECIEYCRNMISPMDALSSCDGAHHEEFKHVLTLLLLQCDSNAPNSNNHPLTETHLAEICSQSRRDKIAHDLHRFLLDALGVTEPTFSLMIRHLINIHNMYHILFGVETKFDKIEQILLSEKEPQQPTTIPLDSGFISETNVMKLVRSLSISSNEAKRALHLANGVLEDAYKAELMRIHLNHDLLVPLALEYCIIRGLHSSQTHTCSVSPSSLISTLHSIEVCSPNSSTDLANRFEKAQELHHIRDAAHAENVEKTIEEVNRLSSNFFQENPAILFKLKQLQFVHLCRRGQWQQAMQVATEDMSSLTLTSSNILQDFKDTILLIGFPHIGDGNDDGEYGEKLLQTMEQQLSSEDISGKLYNSLYVHLKHDDPELLDYVRYLLHSHSMFLQKNAVEDQFAELFSLRKLKHSDDASVAAGIETQLGNAMDQSDEDADIDMAPSRSNRDMLDEDQDDDDDDDEDDDDDDGDDDDGDGDDDDVEISEHSIQMLMEVMRMPRGRAVEILREHDGELDVALETIFGQ